MVFSKREALNDDLVSGGMKLPCGKCAGCRLERSRQWAMRALHESQLYDDNCFITLTYSDADLPYDYGLHYDHFQDFMKRLRFHHGTDIRMMMCGEYGDEYLRPHYHAILFNHDFSDKKLWKQVRGNKLYISDKLMSLWPYGHSTLGDVSFESAAYVARYCMKKYSNPREPEKEAAHYTRCHPLTGLYHRVAPEMFQPSRRPGLGAMWLDRFRSDVFPSDFIVVRGVKCRPPKFYTQKLSEEEIATIKEKRLDHARSAKARELLPARLGRLSNYDETPERRSVREQVREGKMKMLKRTLEGDDS